MKQLLAGAALSLVMAGTAAAQDLEEVTISQAFQSLLYLPLYVGMDQGYFEAEGLSVDKESAGSGPVALNSVIAGSADFSLHGPEWTAIAIEKGAPVVTIANVVNGAAVWVLADEDFTYEGPASFAGEKVVAGMMPTTSTSLFLKLLAENDVDPESVELVSVQIGAEPAPFIGGQAPAAVMYEPGVEQAVAEGKKVILSFVEEYGPYAFSTIMARKDVDPDIAQRFVSGLQAALASIAADPEAAVATALKEFPNLDEAVVEAAVRRMIDEGVYAPSVDITDEAMTTSLNVQIALGNLGALPDFASFIDRRFIDAAVATQ